MAGSVIVAGDVAIDWIGWEDKPVCKTGDRPAVPNWMLYRGLQMIARPGGAALTGMMVEKALRENNLGIQVVKYQLDNIESIPPSKAIHSNTFMKEFPVKGNGDAGPKVYRVSQFYGFAGPENQVQPADEFRLPDTSAEFVILDDAGNGFRDVEALWPRAIRKSSGPLIILKMSQPLATGKLWEHLVAHHRDNLVTVVSANDLRDWGVHLSYRLSWERVAEDFVWQVQNNPIVKPLIKSRHLIVRFGVDGAIHCVKKGEGISADLLYDPATSEDGFAEQYQGKIQGLTCAFITGIACSLMKDPENYPDAIRNGILSARNLFRTGFGSSPGHPDYTFSAIFSISEKDKKKIAAVEIPASALERKEAGTGWTILGTKGRAELEEIAHKTVIYGKDPEMDVIPVGSFEGLKTVDRSEIESYQSIKNLFSEFLVNPKVTRPLSIAVFGPPGSGKSFGITQLALSIEKKKIEKMEFNLSQFKEPKELTAAFHKIRDVILRGRVPLAFFDEFDAALDRQRFGYLKYFLAPMQDGEFREGETVHPIGKAIFIFAGGTCHTFEEFRHGAGDESDKKDHAALLAAAKGTDFISRLRGYIDIMGCNKAGENDRFATIRRAVLLRSLISRNAGHLIDEQGTAAIDPCVVRAFLKVPSYHHGVRSMEAIVDMSLLSAKRRFAQSALPSVDQLQLHVDADRFMRLVLQDVVFNAAVEKMAVENHNRYRVSLKKEGKSSPTDVPWEKLPEDFRESNRNQARHIPDKLRAVGCGLWPGKKGEFFPIDFSDDEIEILARMEHERWMREKTATGWTYGDIRDDAKKLHPDLVAWEELPESEKKKDRDAVREIPVRLADAGFEVYRYD